MLSPQPIATPDATLERAAFNAAFLSLGLRWYWDEERYEALCAEPCERRRLQRYMEAEQAHMLRAYDAAFLTEAILEAKERSLAGLSRSAGPLPGRVPSVDPRVAKVGF
jgi:hypothetical protein